jgi:hypothetical protein
MKKVFVVLALVFGSLGLIQAQHTDQCGYDHLIQELDKKHPGFSKLLDSQYLASIKSITNQKLGKREIDTIYRIPVVFHIVYNTTAENIDDSLIHSQIRVLNEAFRRQNADTVNTRELFKPLAGDARIEFFLATLDPQGNPTDGIVRQNTSTQTFYIGGQTLSADYVKKRSTGGSDPWDTDHYLNIWSCDLSFRGTPFLLGYAYPPFNSSGWPSTSFVGKERQGVVLHYGMIGEDNPNDNVGQNSTREKTAVHEVGHYLGLRHVWGDGQLSNGCAVDDYIDDTPNTSTRNSGCNKNRNTCNEGQDDMPDMIENYMDYSPGSCVNMFTHMQANLMIHNLVELRPEVATIVVPVEPPLIPERRNNLYPVPVEDQITLTLLAVDPLKVYTIEITTALGQLVHSKGYKLNVDQTLLDMSFLTSGFYYFEVKDGDSVVYTRKLVKY